MSKRLVKVYVAGAYSADNVLDVLSNIRRGIRASTEIFLAGYSPFCPWLDYHFQLQLQDNEVLTVKDFYAYSLAWLGVSDFVVVLPDSENSKGTMAEIAYAVREGIPVMSYDQFKKEMMV